MDSKETKAEAYRSISSEVVYNAIVKEGEEELARTSPALFWSGLAAGLSMGLSFVTEALLTSYVPPSSWRILIVKFGYSIGFLIVILGRQQLFTENTLTPVLPFLKQPRLSCAWNVLRLWIIVLAANLLGAAVLAWALVNTSAFEPHVQEKFIEIGRHALTGSFVAIGVKGVFAGWLIALLIWILPFAESARVLVIILITYVIGIGEFSHVIAGAAEVFAVAAAGHESWLSVMGRFIFPALIGNMIGGIALVAAVNHAQAG